jgi:hypothetical protein
MRAFKRRRGMYAARLDADERDVIAALVADVAELLGAGRLEARDPDAVVVGDGNPRMRIEPLPPPSDPAVRRLLPDASRDDPQVAQEFRRLTEDDLRAGKIARLTSLWDALTTPAEGWRADAFVVAPQDAKDVAAAITDLRLVLAERLGIRTDEQAERLYDALVDSPQAELEGLDEILDPAARRYLVAVYGALSWLQESLVDLLLQDLRAPGRPADQ